MRHGWLFLRDHSLYASREEAIKYDPAGRTDPTEMREVESLESMDRDIAEGRTTPMCPPPANARMIAAAPALYAALKGLLDERDAENRHMTLSESVRRGADSARAALRLAEKGAE